MKSYFSVLLIVLVFFSCKERPKDISNTTDFTELFRIAYRPEIKYFIPQNYEVLGIDSGLINCDSLLDFVVALKIIDEKPYFNEEKNEPIRPVLVILGFPDSLIQISRCDFALLAFYMGGVSDPFGSVEIDSMGVIKIINSGGSSHNRWEIMSRFQYDSIENNIYLHEYYSRGYIDDDMGTLVNETHLTSLKFGRVKFEDWSIYSVE